MDTKPQIWFVDDLQSNLDAFIDAHKDYFAVTPFTDPNAVLRRLGNERPDALLCDVFFYDTPEEAQKFEDRVSKEAEALRKTGIAIGAVEDRYLAGITLIEQVAQSYKGSPPFPVYAYTSKGPYLLNQGAWNRIVAAGAEVLLKNRYGRSVERMLIQRDIDRSRERNSWRVKATKHLYTVLIVWGLVATIAGILVDRFLLP